MSSDFQYGKHIREARERLGLSQEAFSQALNVSPRTVARWEADESKPHSASHRVDLAHAFLAAKMPDVAETLNPAIGSVLSEDRVRSFLPESAAGRAAAITVGALGATLFPPIGIMGAVAAGAAALTNNAQKKSAEVSSFERKAQTWEVLVKVAASLQMETGQFSQIAARLVDELDQKNLTLDDLRKVLK